VTINFTRRSLPHRVKTFSGLKTGTANIKDSEINGEQAKTHTGL
jgi:hypothetical protein